MYAVNECHNCGSIWSVGSEEYGWQQCDACGWCPGDPIDDDPGDFDEDDDRWDDDDDSNDPNYSRNI